MPQSPALIGVAGGSGAGKSTLAGELAAALDAPILSLDFYYCDLAHLPPDERATHNFDHPTALEWPLLIAHIERLAAGEAVAAPVYDFATHTRRAETQRIAPSGAVVIEGILALHEAALRRRYRAAVFVDAPEAVRLARRVERDVSRRGRTPEIVREQFERTVRPMHARYVEPSREYADFVADGERPFEDVVRRVAASAACWRRERL